MDGNGEASASAWDELKGLHTKALQLSLQVGNAIERAETATAADGADPLIEARRAFDELQAKSAELRSRWRILSASERSNNRPAYAWQHKVDQVGQKVRDLEGDLNRVESARRRREQEQEERAELLQRAREGDASFHRRDIDVESQCYESATRSIRRVDGMMEQATSILSHLASQRERMKSAHRKALDLLNSSGISESFLRMIERRHRLEQHLVYGGMAVSLLLLFLLWLWLR